VVVEPFEDRATKSLLFKASKNISSSSDEARTFELYVIRDELRVNPIAANAPLLRDLSDICSITFGKDTGSETTWLQNVFASISCAGGKVTICRTTDCTPIYYADKEGKKNVVREYRDCSCDVVMGVDSDKKLFLHTVSFKGANETLPNDIVLLGIFESPLRSEVTAEEAFGIISKFTVPAFHQIAAPDSNRNYFLPFVSQLMNQPLPTSFPPFRRFNHLQTKWDKLSPGLQTSTLPSH